MGIKKSNSSQDTTKTIIQGTVTIGLVVLFIYGGGNAMINACKEAAKPTATKAVEKIGPFSNCAEHGNVVTCRYDIGKHVWAEFDFNAGRFCTVDRGPIIPVRSCTGFKVMNEEGRAYVTKMRKKLPAPTPL
ncbi:MAG: hypothetical protein U9N14_03565 [Pseudomonadota bacterium]|nr:hypothetical protein [Pseudomonadota bacterium]